MRLRPIYVPAIAVTGVLCSVLSVSAWTAAPASPPANNVAAPVNVGSVNQVKNSNLSVNGLAVFGNSILQASSYLNWGATAGSTGYGIRDNAGTLEFKISGATDGPAGNGWKTLQYMISNLGGQWTTSGNNIYNSNSGNVGIGTPSPAQKLSVAGTIESTSGGVKFPDGTTQTTAATGISGGVANTLPKFTAATTLGNSTVSDDGSTVNIGAASFHSGGSGADNYLPFSNGSNYIRPKAGGATYVRNAIYDEDNTAYYIDPNGGSSFSVVTATDYYSNSWFRLNGGGTGLYWQLYGTSVTASDATWVRVNPYLYTNQGYDSGGASAAGCGGGLGGGYTFRVCGSAAATSFLYSSDRRLKDNIKPIDNSLWKVLQLNGVSFTWNSGDRKGQQDIGVIAQDVQKIVPEAVTENPQTHMLSVDYPRLTPLLINAIREQQIQINNLTKRLEALEQNSSH